MKLLAVFFLLLGVSSCHQYRVTSPHAYYPLPVKVSKKPEKEGLSCATYIPLVHSLFSSRDLTVENARANGDISEIISIEERNTFVYPFYAKVCVVVKGN